MKVIVNDSKCVGCGACAFTSPDFFKVEGKAIVIKQPTNTEEEEKCEAGRASCPMGAIEITA